MFQCPFRKLTCWLITNTSRKQRWPVLYYFNRTEQKIELLLLCGPQTGQRDDQWLLIHWGFIFSINHCKHWLLEAKVIWLLGLLFKLTYLLFPDLVSGIRTRCFKSSWKHNCFFAQTTNCPEISLVIKWSLFMLLLMRVRVIGLPETE